MKNTYIPTLDGWRATAILLVLFAHAYPSVIGAESARVAFMGTFGVRLFFGLSGFLITSLLIAEERLNTTVDLLAFYIRRIFRIMPAASTMLLAVAVLSSAGLVHVTGRRWIDTLLFFSNYSSAPQAYSVGHFWSLAVEEHFYLIWPSLFVVATTIRNRIGISLAICITLATWRTVAFKYQITTADTAQFWGRTDICGDAILWGAVLALLSSDVRRKAVLTSLAARVTVPLGLAVSLVGILFIDNHWKLNFLLTETSYIFIPAMVLQTASGQSYISKTLDSHLFRWIGRRSYSIYLWQQLFLTPDHIGFLRLFPVNLLAALGCAIACYHFVERPLISVGHSLARPRSNQRDHRTHNVERKCEAEAV